MFYVGDEERWLLRVRNDRQKERKERKDTEDNSAEHAVRVDRTPEPRKS